MYQPGSDEFALAAMRMIGEDAEAFFRSDLGQYVIGRAEEQVKTAVDAIKTIDPADCDGVAMLQYQIRSAEGAIKWLNQAISEGKMALALLEERMTE